MDITTKDRLLFTATCFCAVALYYAGLNGVSFIWIISNGFSYISIMFHEIGHAIFGWLYGYPAFPAFDFVNGGGITLHQDRSWVLQGAVWVGLVYIGYQFWRMDDRVFFIAYGLFAVFLGLTALFDFHEDIQLFMGLGAEALVGSFFLARAYFNTLLIRQSERWLNSLLGAYMVFGVFYLAWHLMYDAYFAANYEAQKGAHRFGDLHRIQDNLLLMHIHPVCWALIVFIVLCLILNFLALYYYKVTRGE